MTTAPVLIAGAGPVGVVSAILLARRGIRSIVIERHAQPYGLPRAVHIDDEVFRILQAVGVADRFAEISRPMPGLRLLDASYRTMAEFPRSTEPSAQGFPQANFFDQPDLELILREAMAQYPQIELRRSVEVVDLDQGDRSVRVLLRDLVDSSEAWVETPALLGCDGANSTVRNAIGATVENLGYEERWCVVDVRCARQLPVWPGMYQVCDPARATTFGQIGPDRYRWEFHLAEGEEPATLLAPDMLRSLIAPVLGSVPFEELDFMRTAQYTFRAQVADTWQSGRVFLLGDAAHLTPPFIGQGLCAGLRDAANLTWKLAWVLGRAAPEDLLSTYQAERKPHATRFIRLAMLVGWTMTGGQDRAAAVRKGILAVGVRLPGFTRAVLNQAAPPVAGGALASRPRARRSPVGRPVPQPWVEHDGRRVRLDEVLGSGFAVVVSTPPTWRIRYLAERLDARLVHVISVEEAQRSSGRTVAVIDVTGTFQRWLDSTGGEGVVVRPDRIVLEVLGAQGSVDAEGLALVEPRR